MTLEVEEPNFSYDGTVCITMIVSTSRPRSEVRLQRLASEYIPDHPSFPWLDHFLPKMGVPETFLNGHDCDIVEKLSRMLHDSIIQRRGGGTQRNCFSIFVMVFNSFLTYNIVDTTWFCPGNLVPPSEFVRSMACLDGGEYSLPAGATTLERFKAQDHEQDNCIICLQEFNSCDDAARLPCSHVCHYDCILEWFVRSGTCPMCRFSCSHASCHCED